MTRERTRPVLRSRFGMVQFQLPGNSLTENPANVKSSNETTRAYMRKAIANVALPALHTLSRLRSIRVPLRTQALPWPQRCFPPTVPDYLAARYTHRFALRGLSGRARHWVVPPRALSWRNTPLVPEATRPVRDQANHAIDGGIEEPENHLRDDSEADGSDQPE